MSGAVYGSPYCGVFNSKLVEKSYKLFPCQDKQQFKNTDVFSIEMDIFTINK